MIVHVWQERTVVDPKTEKRNALARSTWGWMFNREFNDNHFIRFANTTIKGETRDFPYLKDVLKLGCLGLKDDDVIVFTNADSCLSEDFMERALELLETHQAIHCHRRDFEKLEGPLRSEEIPLGDHYPGSDAFVFPAGWWRKHHSEFPDMLLGVNCFDWILRELIKLRGGVELKDGVYHQAHDTFWSSPEAYKTNPSNIYNRELARKWLLERKLPLNEINFKEKP